MPVVRGKIRESGNYIPLKLAATLLFTNTKSLKKMLKRGDLPYARSWRGERLVKQADVLDYVNSHKDIEGVNGYSRGSARNGGDGIGNFFDDLGELIGDLGDFSL